MDVAVFGGGGVRAAAEDFERKKTVHEDTARQYRVAAGQLEQMTEGAMSEAMITEHQLLAVDHTNIARIDDEFAAMGRRLAEMAHSLSAHLDDIDYRSATGDLIVTARAPCRHHYRSARESGRQFSPRLPPMWPVSAPRPKKKLGDWLPESSGEHLPIKTPRRRR